MKIPLALKKLYWDYKWMKALPMSPDFFVTFVDELLKQKGMNVWTQVSVNKDGTFKIALIPKNSENFRI